MIVVDKVSKYYGVHPAVHNLEFRIDEGECVGFLGLNGAGKTTTLRILSCLLLPTSGRVTIKGLDAEEAPHEIRKLIGFLPDTPPLYPEMTVRDFLGFAGRLRRMEREAVERRVPEVLSSCGLEDVAQQTIATLSHGYKQRVGIAQAIVHEPKLLILDEPIQGLDPVQIVEMREMIRALRGQHTILLSSHILSEIQQTCDRILMLHEGRIAATAAEEELAGSRGKRIRVRLEVRARSVPDHSEGGPESALRTALRDVSDVLEINVSKQSERSDVWTADLSLGLDCREEVAQALVKAGFGLRSLELKSTGLEQMFLQLSHQGGEKPGTSSEEQAS